MRPWLLYYSLPVPVLTISEKASVHDSLAEWSKALASGASPQGRGFEPHSCHFPYVVCFCFLFSKQVLAQSRRFANKHFK